VDLTLSISTIFKEENLVIAYYMACENYPRQVAISIFILGVYGEAGYEHWPKKFSVFW